MFKTSDVMLNTNHLFQPNYGYTVVETSWFHYIFNHCFQKLKNSVVTEPPVYINETQICFSMSSYGSVTYYKNVFNDTRLVYYHIIKINLFVLQPWSDVLIQTKPNSLKHASCFLGSCPLPLLHSSYVWIPPVQICWQSC